jgi:hypothetical protein
MRAYTGLMRTICNFCAVFSVVCFVAAALIFARLTDAGVSRGPLRLASVHQSLGDLPPGVEIPVSFTVTNQSSRSVTLLGVSQFCVDWGCVYATGGFPADLAPHTSGTVSMHVRIATRGRTGKFAAEVILYSDCPGLGQTQLTVTGNVVPVPEG